MHFNTGNVDAVVGAVGKGLVEIDSSKAPRRKYLPFA
jgi:hypothetical protein